MARAILRGCFQACVSCGLASLAPGTDREDFQSGGIGWLTRVTLPRNRLESLSSRQSSFCTEFGHRVKIGSLDDFGIFSSSRRLFSRRGPCHGRRSRSPGAHHRSPQYGEGDRSRLCPQRDPPRGLPELRRDFCRPRGVGVTGRCSHVLERWHDDTSAEAREEASGSRQRTGVLLSSTLGKLYAKYLRNDATAHVQSAVLPTQLGGFPSNTIEFGNHLVHQRAAFYKQKGVTSAVIFLDLTASLLDDNARAVLLGAPSSRTPQSCDS